MVIHQGDVFWVNLGEPRGSEPAYHHPFLVVQNNLLNRSNIRTAVGVFMTSNMARAISPGNAPLRKGEASLPKPSVVNVTQIATVDKDDLVDRIGRVSPARVEQILEGIRLITEPRDVN